MLMHKFRMCTKARFFAICEV